MKKKNRLFVLSLTSLLGLTLMGCDMAKAIPNSEKEEPEVINDEVTYNDHFGTLVKLGAAPSSDPKNVAIATSFGYQIAEESADKMSVRIIAAVDDYKGISSAKITSKVVGYREEKNTPSENEEVVKEETEFAVTAVYSSLSADLDIKWTTALDTASFASPYFMVYTLNDIPSEHWFDTISVTFSATATNNASQSFVFNAMGLHGDYARNISYTLDEGRGGYVTYKNSTASSISKIYLPEKHVEINSFYAKPLGDIVALNTTGTTGTFENVTGITEIHLPKTIKEIGGWAFSTSSLKKVNIPENVVSTGSTILSSSAHIEELSYEAKNLVNDSNSYSATIDVVKVSKKVESLPNKFFSSSYLPKKVIYEGTEAEWAALKNEGNADNGFFIDEVYCSDTTTSIITYHYGEGKIGETTGDVALTVINGHTLPNPGNPIANEAGQEFKGWFLDEALTIPADFTSSVSANVDLYAKYGDFGPGISMANPLVLTPASASSFSASLVPGKKAEFIKFEMPANAAADWFYLTIESNGCVVDRSVSTATYTRLGIEAYDAQGNKLDIGSQGITNDKKVQKISNDDYRIRFYAEAGEAIYFKAMLHSGNEDVYGTIAFSFNTYANDSIGEAIPMAFGESKAVSFVSKYQRVLYSYTATETKTVALRKNQIGGANGGFTVVDAADPTHSLGSFSKSFAGLVLLDQVAGHTYLIEANATDASTADSYITLLIEDAPQGALAVDPIAYTLGDEFTVGSIAPQYVYYSFNVEEESDLKFTFSSGSSSYAKEYAILDSNGEVVSTGVEKGKTISSWGSTETTYGTEMVAKAHLVAGSYTLKIGYSELPISWTSMEFKGVVLHEGDEPENAFDGRITLGVPSILQGSVEGKWYKLTSSAANYLIMQLDGAPSGMKVALYDAAGTTKLKEVSSIGSSLFYKTAADTDYLIYVYGASGEATLMFSRQDSYETGEKKEEAISLNGSLKDVTQFAGKTIWLKFTTGEAGLYKLFTRSLLGGNVSSGNGNDSNILGLYTADSETAVKAASGPTHDDKHAHNETGGNYDTYAEYNLEASTTYFVKLSLGSTNTSYDVVKFGVRGNEPGSSKDSAFAADLSGNSFSGSFSEIGTWYQFTTSSAESLSLSFSGLEGAKATIYNSSLSKVGEVASGASDPLVAVLASETLYYLVLSGASGEANIALGHESAPDYSITNIRGVNGDNSDNGSVKTIHEGLGWVTTENDGELKSNIAGIDYGRAAYKMTVTVSGTVSFSWASSGERGYDYLMVFVNGQEVVGKNDNPAPVASYDELAWHDFSRLLAAGDEISIVFRKDSSGKDGMDADFIKNFSFSVVE